MDDTNKSLPETITSNSDADSFSIIKSLRQKANSDSGSSNGDNHSDNSALVSIGNGSFGYNFDGPSSEQNENSSESDGGSGPLDSQLPAVSVSSSNSNTTKNSRVEKATNPAGSKASSIAAREGHHRSITSPSIENRKQYSAEESTARLKSIATSCFERNSDKAASKHNDSRKRKGVTGSENWSSGGYNSDEDDDDDDDHSGGNETQSKSRTDSRGGESIDGKGKKKKVDIKRREERNAREKERSFRISRQINELRDILSNGGIILPKGTKSSVLTEAANYIRLLQQHQYRSEIERHQLIQQMHLIGEGAHGPQAAQAIRHAAAQNGVWSLGNFGGMPPSSAMTYQTPPITKSDTTTSGSDVTLQPSVSMEDYRFIFNSCGVAMAIASMGGAFIDCNELFSKLSDYTKQELCSLTVFNLTARSDLQHAFDLISQMISPPMNETQENAKQVLLRGSLKNRNDLGLCVSLVKGDNGVSKCFCVTLIKSPSSPFDTEAPVPVSFESVIPSSNSCPAAFLVQPAVSGKLIATTPAFTSG